MVTIVLAASVFAAAACGGDSQGVVRGVIIDVQSTSLTTLESLTLRDDSGKVWTFSAQGPLGFTPSHLREHQTFAHPVTVRYKQTDDGLAAISVSD